MSEDSRPMLEIDGQDCPILCGNCKSQVDFGGDAQDDTTNIVCLSCGNADSTNNVVAIVTDYATNEAQLRLNRMARDVATRGKFMTFSGDTEHNQKYAFVVQF